MANKKYNIELDPKMNQSALRTISEQLTDALSAANKNGLQNSYIKAKNSYDQHGGNYMSGTTGANFQAKSDEIVKLMNVGQELTRELKKLKSTGGSPEDISRIKEQLGYGTSHNFNDASRFAKHNGLVRQETPTRVGLGSTLKPLNDDFTRLHEEGRTSRPAGIKGSFEDQAKHRQNLRGIANEFGGAKTNANEIGGQIKRNRNTLTDAQSRGKISYEAYTALKGRMSSQYSQLDTAISGNASKKDTIDTKIKQANKSIKDVNASDKDSETKLRETSELNDQIKALQKQKEQIDEATNALAKFKQQLDGQNTTLNKSVENKDIRVGHSKDSVLGMLESRKTSLLLGASGNAINGIKNGINGGNQLRQQIEGSINGSTLGNAINGGSTIDAADNHLQDRLASSGVPFGKSVAEMAQYTGALNSTGVTSASRLASGANQMAGFSRYNNVDDQTTSQMFQTLGQSGALGNNPSNTISSLSKQFSGMLANNKLGGRAQEQAEGLNSIYGTAQAQGGTMSTNEAKQLMAMQSVLSKGKDGKSMVGQQGAQNIAGVANMFSSNGFNDPFLRAGFAGTNAKYSGQQGLYHLQSDMMNPLAHPESMSNGIRAMAQGRGGYWGAVEKLQENGVDQKGAQQIVKQSLNGNISNSNLKKIADAENKSGSSAQKRSKAQFKANGNSTLDIKVAIDDEGKMRASESMDKGRAASNGAMAHVNNSGAGSLTGSIVGSVASGAGGFLGLVGSNLLSKGAGKILGKTKLGTKISSKFANSKVANSKLGKIFDWDKVGAKGTSEAAENVVGKHFASTAESASKSASKGAGLFAKGSSMLGKATPLLKTGGKVLGKVAMPLTVATTGIDALSQLKGINNKNKGRKIGKAGGLFAGGLGGMAAGASGGAAAGAALGSVVPVLGTTVGGVAGGAIGGIAGGFAGSDLGKSVGGFLGSMFDSKKKTNKKSTGKETKSTKKQTNSLLAMAKDVHTIKNAISTNKVQLSGTAGSNGTNKNDNSYDNKSDADIAHAVTSSVDDSALANNSGSTQTFNQALKFDFRGSSAPASEVSKAQSMIQQLVSKASSGTGSNNDFWSTSKTLS